MTLSALLLVGVLGFEPPGDCPATKGMRRLCRDGEAVVMRCELWSGFVQNIEKLGVSRFTAIFNTNTDIPSARKAYIRAFIRDADVFRSGREFANPQHAFTQAMLECGGMDSA